MVILNGILRRSKKVRVQNAILAKKYPCFIRARISGLCEIQCQLGPDMPYGKLKKFTWFFEWEFFEPGKFFSMVTTMGKIPIQITIGKWQISHVKSFVNFLSPFYAREIAKSITQLIF